MTRMLIGTGVLAAIGILLAASAVVIGEERRSQAPHLAVSISGVPGYVYYDRDYVITFEYINSLGGTAEDVTLSAVLPRDFTLDGRVSTKEQQSVVWQLGDLEPGQSGKVTATLRGTIPTDLTNAVYDLPNYVGHTAFIDGLAIDVKLTSSAGTVAARALADTGGNGPSEGDVNTITIIKNSVPNHPQDFMFDPGGNCLDVNQNPITCPAPLIINADVNFTLDNDDPDDTGSGIWPDRRTFTVNANARVNARHSITEILPNDDWIITNIACTPPGVPQVAEFAFAQGNVTSGPDYDPAFNPGDDTVWFNITVNQGFLSCTFTNTHLPAADIRGVITVTKETSAETTETFDFEMTGPFSGFDESFSLGDGEDESFRVTRGEYTIREIGTAGWRLDEIDCGREGTVDTANASVSFFLQAGQSVDCIFHNVEDPLAAAAETPTSAASQPNVTGAIGGIIAGARRDPTPTPGPAVAAAVATASATPRAAGAMTISPPSTGDGGIR